MTNVKLPELPDNLPDLIHKLNVFEQAALLEAIQNYAIAAVELNRVVVDDALVSVAVEAFLASTGQSHPVTQLQRDLVTTCMRVALTAAMAKE